MAELSIRVNPKGDTCVDNHGTAAPYVTVSSQLEGGAYRVMPGQRVTFEHGSLQEVVDHEPEACGCPIVPPVSVAKAAGGPFLYSCGYGLSHRAKRGTRCPSLSSIRTCGSTRADPRRGDRSPRLQRRESHSTRSRHPSTPAGFNPCTGNRPSPNAGGSPAQRFLPSHRPSLFENLWFIVKGLQSTVEVSASSNES